AYPNSVGIIQASWNWPHYRKDMDIYGETGELHQIDPDTLVYREGDLSLERRKATSSSTGSRNISVRSLTGPDADEFAYLAAVVRGAIKPSGPSSLATNLIVMEILDAARESARTGRRINFS